MAILYEAFEQALLEHSFHCDEVLLSTPDGSWNSSDSSLISPVISPNPSSAISSGAPTSSVAVSPAIPIENLLQDHTVKVQRLSRKAKLARENRKRKNSRLRELEDECQDLREEVKRLRQRERNAALESQQNAPFVKEKRETHEAILRQQLRDIVAKTNNGVEEDNVELQQAVATLINYLDKRGRHSLSEMRVSLDAAFQQLNKGPEQFLFWILSRSDKSFFQDATGMWRRLFSEHLAISDEKLLALEQLGPVAQEMRRNCSEVYEHFKNVSIAFEKCLSQGRDVVEKTMSFITREQQAKFIQWVYDNQICVNELVLH